MSRSPSAEVVFRILARRMKLHVEADSVGVFTGGAPHISAMRHALAVKGYDPGDEARIGRLIQADDLKWADVVVAMEHTHLAEITLAFGEPRQAHLFMELAGEGSTDTPDPYMGDCTPDEFIEWAERVARALLSRVT
ncbi:MAG: hypothetical protein JJU11_13320 [Candidatus Sumerlaeia bacterium]|nr:hypothetical protein [Candidatus Sumerlaeia bacterium]